MKDFKNGVAYILILIGSLMIILGLVDQIVETKCKTIDKNTDFWVKKINRNIERDKEEQRLLATMGWHCITVWECELKKNKREKTLSSLAYTLNHIFLQDRSLAYSIPEIYGDIAAEPEP